MLRSLRSLTLLGSLGLASWACAPPTAATPYPGDAPAEGEPIVAAEAPRDDVVRFLDREGKWIGLTGHSD